MTIRPMTLWLRSQGFKLEYRCRFDKSTVTEFSKRVGDRCVKVQFWSSGQHRASHGRYGKYGLAETTPPTNFQTKEQMIVAVAHEWRRPTRRVHGR